MLLYNTGLKWYQRRWLQPYYVASFENAASTLGLRWQNRQGGIRALKYQGVLSASVLRFPFDTLAGKMVA